MPANATLIFTIINTVILVSFVIGIIIVYRKTKPVIGLIGRWSRPISKIGTGINNGLDQLRTRGADLGQRVLSDLDELGRRVADDLGDRIPVATQRQY